MLRGRAEPMRAFEPLRPERDKDADADAYRRAFALLNAGDSGALAAFAAYVARQGEDQLATFHLKRLLNGAKGTRIVLD